MANEMAQRNLFPVSALGVEKSLRSAAPHKAILCVSIQSVSQTGEMVVELDNTYLLLFKFTLTEKSYTAP